MEMTLGSPVKQLLVDLDGTLLGNRHLNLSLDFISKSVGTLSRYGGARQAIATLVAIMKEFKRPSPDIANDVRIVSLFAKRMKLSQDEARAFLREHLLIIFPQLQKHFFPVQGAEEFLEWARQRYPLLLATNPVWPPEIVELRVKWAGIDPSIFMGMTHIRRMHACKPTAEYYREILAQEKIQAEDCLLIGDDVKMDLPATRVGIRVFIVGKYKQVSPLKHPGAQAQAWRGPYPALRTLLETGAK
jgi:FMN phosphatase YigB (HAD superfamily)